MTKPTPIDCRTAFRRLYDYLDRELDPDEVVEVEAHLAVCTVCAAEYEFESRVLEEIRIRARSAHVPDGLKARVRELLESAESSDPSPPSKPGETT